MLQGQLPHTEGLQSLWVTTPGDGAASDSPRGLLAHLQLPRCGVHGHGNGGLRACLWVAFEHPCDLPQGTVAGLL